MNFMIRNIIRIRRVCFSFARGYIKIFYVPVHADFIFKLTLYVFFIVLFDIYFRFWTKSSTSAKVYQTNSSQRILT